MNGNIKELIKKIEDLIQLRINTLNHYRKLDDFQERADFFSSINKSNNLSKAYVLQLTSLIKQDVFILGESWKNQNSIVNRSNYPSILNHPQFFKTVRSQCSGESKYTQGTYQTLLDFIEQHFQKEDTLIKEYIKFLGKRRFAEMSAIKVKQLINLIKGEEQFLPDKNISSTKDINYFINFFSEYEHFFKEGYFFAHFTKSIKPILKTGAILSWESFEKLATKPFWQLSNTKIKLNNIESACFDVNSFDHLEYGKYCLIFPLHSFKKQNLIPYKTSMEGQSVDVYPKGGKLGKLIYVAIHALRNNLYYMVERREKSMKRLNSDLSTLKSWIKDGKYDYGIDLCKKYPSLNRVIDFIIEDMFNSSEYNEKKNKELDSKIVYINKHGAIGHLMLYSIIKKKGYDLDGINIEELYDEFEEAQKTLWEKAIKYCLKHDKEHLVLPVNDCLLLSCDEGVDKLLLKSPTNVKSILIDEALWKKHRGKDLLLQILSTCKKNGINLREIPLEYNYINNSTGEIVLK